MSLEFRPQQQPPELGHSFGTGGPPEELDQACDARNVLVTSGIHRGRFPIGGLSVRECRDALRRLVNIEEGSVAVINGQAVEDDEIIGEDVTHVAFVKPSAIKG
jgi:hypothetical protein